MPHVHSAQAIAQRLVAAIRAKGTTASAVAKACGFSRQNMQRFINGEVSRSRHFPKIADAVGVPVVWLTMGDRTAEPSWWSAQTPTRQRGSDEGLTQESVSAAEDEKHTRSQLASLKHLVMRGDRGRPVAYDGMRLLVDTESTPDTGDVIVLEDAEGMELVCCGEVYEDRIVVSGVDRGLGGRLVLFPSISKAPIVVGVLF